MADPDTKALSILAVTGRTEAHLCSTTEAAALGGRVHKDVVDPFLRLREEALRAGFRPTVFSGFRSFERQLSIWNRKARGELAVLDRNSEPLDITRLDERALVFAILRWSALPGASRHHWGTDLDLIDAATTPEGYEVQLVPGEVDSGGIYGPFHDWLDERMGAQEAFGFFRPYDEDRGGVAPERWHLSHAPVAASFEGRLTVGSLKETIAGADMELKETVLAHLEEIYDRFVVNTAKPAGLPKPATPAKPTGSMKPATPAKPTGSTKPATPAKPTGSTKPATPAKPTGSTKPATPDEHSGSAQPIDLRS